MIQAIPIQDTYKLADNYTGDQTDWILHEQSGRRYLIAETPFAVTAFSKVYKGTDLETSTQVVIKETRHNHHMLSRLPTDPLVGEALFLNALDHPNIVRYHDIFPQVFNQPYVTLVLEYVPGQDLHKLIAANKLSSDERFIALRQVASALDYIHSSCHYPVLDIKPSNIIFDKSTGIAKLIDFGAYPFAAALNFITSIGTASYMSGLYLAYPEAPDRRQDLFAFGITCFEVLFGYNPVTSQYGDTAKIPLQATPNELRSLIDSLRVQSEVRSQLSAILNKIWAYEYGCADELVNDLHGVTCRKSLV